MKTKNYIITGLVSVAAVIITSIIINVIEYIFKINIPESRFIIGWIGASVYYVSIRKQTSKNILTPNNLNADITKMNSDLIDAIKERNHYKSELEYMKNKYDNLKSEMIVQKNIKY